MTRESSIAALLQHNDELLERNRYLEARVIRLEREVKDLKQKLSPEVEK